jgi:hypothetical protein
MMILDDIPLAIDLEQLSRDAGLSADADPEDRESLARLARNAEAIARPKACYLACDVAVDGDRVVLGGVAFTSGLMAENLKNEKTVWAYVATGGMELYRWARALEDPYERFWGEAALKQSLVAASGALFKAIGREHDGTMAVMSPGSLPEWPLSEQRPLFHLLAGGVRAIGVTLEASLLMTPNQSISGVRFPNAHGYVNCRLCPKANCPNRRAAYDEGMAEKLRGHHAV